MPENWNDWGNLRAEESYNKRSTLGKIFSWRTIGKVLKGAVILVISSLILVVLFRIFTSQPSAKMNRLIMTPDTAAAVSKYGNLSVLAQETGSTTISSDGRFSVYETRYIVETGELQFTVRYNNSTTAALRDRVSARYDVDEDALRKEICEKYQITDASSESERATADAEFASALAEATAEADSKRSAAVSLISDFPFVFALKDNLGNYYTDYSYVEYSKNFYRYVRVSFKVPGLFCAEISAPDNFYPSPDAENPFYIYKGANAGSTESTAITSVALESYYYVEASEMSPFGSILYVYTSGRPTENYNAKKELSTEVAENLKSYSITE